MGTSSECGAGRHRTCPGYYRMTHPCGCGCHTACQHPVAAAQWDPHRALLLCTSCGREVDGTADTHEDELDRAEVLEAIEATCARIIWPSHPIGTVRP